MDTPQMMIIEVDALRPAEYNPRTIDAESLQALKRSLVQDPDFLKVNFIVVNTHPGRENVVFIGAQRLRAAKELGWTKVPVLLANVDEQTERAWNIKANHHQGQFDLTGLQAVVTDLHASGYDMNALGYVPDELTSIMATPEIEGDVPSEGGVAGKKMKEVECPECHHRFVAE